MRWTRSLVFLSCLLLGAQDAAAQGTIQQICGGLQDVFGCSKKIDIPVGAKSKTCPNKIFEAVPCKTKATYRYPCPTWSKPTRMCDGWTCVPGTKEKWVDLPCGVTIITKKVDLCQLVRTSMGGVGAQFLSKTGAVCNCLPQALDMLGKNLFNSVRNGADLSAAVSALISDVVKLQKCMIDNGFSVKDNKGEIMANDLSTTGGWVVAPAAEIDLATYGELVAAISPCFLAGGCQPNLIRTFFTNYLTKSKELMGDRIAGVLTGWLDILGKIEARIKDIIAAAEGLLSRVATVPSKIEGIEKRVCKNDACLGPVIKSFMQKVSQAITTVQTFKDVKTAAATLSSAVPKMVKIIDATIEVANTIPDATYFIQLILDGKLKKIEDILDSIKITKELPKVVAQIQSSATTIVEFITRFAASGDAAVALLDDVLSTAWEGYPLEFTTDSSGNVRAGLVEMQKILESELVGPFKNVTKSISALDDALDLFPVKSGKFAFKAQVASYRRWSTVSMDLPCTRKKTAKYEIAGFKGSFDYPEFYACKYGPKEIPWPNHHVPYVKFKIG